MHLGVVEKTMNLLILILMVAKKPLQPPLLLPLPTVVWQFTFSH
jgi:hypothetical protein